MAGRVSGAIRRPELALFEQTRDSAIEQPVSESSSQDGEWWHITISALAFSRVCSPRRLSLAAPRSMRVLRAMHAAEAHAAETRAAAPHAAV